MRPIVAIALCLVLSGCATRYSIVLLEPPSDPAIYAKDIARCTQDTNNYKHTFDFGSVGFGAISGASQSAAEAVVGGPLIVAVGAAGGASDAANQSIDLFGTEKQNVFHHCVEALTDRDGSALPANPN